MIIIDRTIRYSVGNNIQPSFPLISTSLETDYIPFYSIFLSEFKKIKDFRYNVYWINTENAVASSSLIRLKDFFNYALRPIMYRRDNTWYYIMKHLIFTIDTTGVPIVLYSTVFHKEYWRHSDFANLDKSKIFYIINFRFSEPQFKGFYNYFRKYILPDMEGGIDIIYASSMERYCFKPVEISLQFPTIAERKNYLSEINRRALDEFFK